MIWVLIVLLAMALVIVSRRYVNLQQDHRKLRSDFNEVLAVAKSAAELNVEILEGQKEQDRLSDQLDAEVHATMWTLIQDRDDAHKMLEMVLDTVPERIEGHRQISSEIGINGVVYQFHKDRILAPA